MIIYREQCDWFRAGIVYLLTTIEKNYGSEIVNLFFNNNFDNRQKWMN